MLNDDVYGLYGMYGENEITLPCINEFTDTKEYSALKPLANLLTEVLGGDRNCTNNWLLLDNISKNELCPHISLIISASVFPPSNICITSLFDMQLKKTKYY